jgi:hypothetical protein
MMKPTVEIAMLRSLCATSLALTFCACSQPDLPQDPPTSVVTAVFDPTTSQIPLPNDLVFFVPLNSVCPGDAAMSASTAPACAQAELVASFGTAFPSDQELPITIDFTETAFTDGKGAQIAPDLDLTTFTPTTFYVFNVGTQSAVPTDPLTSADYVKGDDHGTLTIHNAGRLPWAPGSYALVIRGGADGVKTKDGIPVTSSQIFDLIAQGKDLTDPANNGLLVAQANGSQVAAKAQGEQLNAVIALYSTTAFPAADKKFAHQELAIAATFKIAPTVTNVEIDPARGQAPLPFDLLRDPKTGTIGLVAACTFVGSTAGADGKCHDKTGAVDPVATAQAAGFQTIDGFSTTGPLLAATSDLVTASTVTAATVKIYDLSTPDEPALVVGPDETTTGPFIFEPCEFTSAALPAGGCGPRDTALAPAIVIQPAGATAGDPTSVFRTRPLKDNTDYAVVFTTGILDKAGKAIGPGTVAKILQFKNPLAVDGKSGLQGIDDTTAQSLEAMRLQLQPVFDTLAADGIPASKVALAYTFHTQSIGLPAAQLAALPYTEDDASGIPGPLPGTVPAVTATFDKYGVPTTTVPHDNIDELLEFDITTFNALDPVTGAFLADPRKAVKETIHVLMATPLAGKVTKTCSFQLPIGNTVLTPKCAPLVIFRHGLRGGRANMLQIADTLANAGMVTVAIDAAKHGDRSLCQSALPSPDNGCIGTCTAIPGAQGQGDTAAAGGPPGTCDAQGLVKNPVVKNATHTDGIAAASSNYLVSANFFRTRDSLRQDLIDQSQLLRTLVVFPPGNALFLHMAGRNVVIDPTPGQVFFVGQSLGAIQGAMDVAANPRISKAALNVGGGTLVDLFTNSPAFKPTTDAILTGLGIVRGTPTFAQQFAQFLVVAKTVLDPADPINFVGRLTGNNLPNLLPPLGGDAGGQVAQQPKQVLTQVALCDQTVINAFGFVFSGNAGVSLTAPHPTPNAAFELFTGTGFTGDPSVCNEATAAESLVNFGGGHAFLTDFNKTNLTLAAQADVAAFLGPTSAQPAAVRSF